eukprot:860348-Pleurochrysis_carterae.AAC.2
MNEPVRTERRESATGFGEDGRLELSCLESDVLSDVLTSGCAGAAARASEGFRRNSSASVRSARERLLRGQPLRRRPLRTCPVEEPALLSDSLRLLASLVRHLLLLRLVRVPVARSVAVAARRCARARRAR